jgi:hypothetical protein
MAAEQPLERSVEMEPGGGALHRLSAPWRALGITLAGALAVALLQGAKPFYYDALNYWTLGGSFTSHGDFSLLNFHSPLRGYLLPLITHGLQGLSAGLAWGPSTSAKLFNVLVISVIAALLGPQLARVSWPGQSWSVARRLALAALLLLFWSGYLNFPLSDLPALALVLAALTAAARPRAPLWMLLAGVATGAAINMRPSYVSLLVIVPILVVWAWLEQRGAESSLTSRRLLCVGCLVGGFVLVSLPQSLISHRHFGSWSFVPGSAAHLESLQMTEGLRLQRYETFVGSGHGPQMLYEDPAGRRLLASRPHETVTGAADYLELVAGHPLTMAGVFARHVINGLDQRYSTPYIEHLDGGSHRWMRLAGFLLIFLALLRTAWPAARRSLGPARWRYPCALLLCCVTSVPSAMETRFVLPVYLLGYVLVVAPGWPSPIAAGETGLRAFRTVGAILVAYGAFMTVVWYVASGATGHLHFA